MIDLSSFTGGAPSVWVSGATYAAGKVVWSPTDFQYFMRKTAGAGTTDPASDPTYWQPTGDRAVKSIQRGTAGATTTSITISAVNPAKTELRGVGYGKDASGIVQVVLYGYLTNATTITVNGAAGYSGGGGFSWELTERY